MANVERIVLEPRRRININTQKRSRVAAYCRVSTDMEEQQGSFEGQVKTYTALIRSHADWELAGIYADEGFSGTNAAGRPQFLRMIKDCEEGKIDLIITKSISRFARNTLECLTYVRHLQNLGVNILFENNNIDTRTAFSEMLLTILAAFAQEESRSISENTKWGIRKRFENGISRWCRLYGYTSEKGVDYTIVPEQAAVVQKIFSLYEHGENIGNIKEYLEKNNIPSPEGKETWERPVILRILKNERYAGDILLQKYLTTDHISHRAVKNACTEVPAYYIENHHTPIINRKTFDRVQKILEMQSIGTASGRRSGKCIQYPFGGLLRCPDCGQPLHQRAVYVQTCRNRTQGWCCEVGEDACRGFVIRSQFVEEAVLEAYRRVDIKAVERKAAEGKTAKTREAARILLSMKKQHPQMERVDYYWLDDLVAKIELGAHSHTPTEFRRMMAKGETFVDDRVLTVFWKAGLKTTVPTGIKLDKDDPRHIAGLYQAFLERHEDKKLRGEKQIETGMKKGNEIAVAAAE